MNEPFPLKLSKLKLRKEHWLPRVSPIFHFLKKTKAKAIPDLKKKKKTTAGKRLRIWTFIYLPREYRTPPRKKALIILNPMFVNEKQNNPSWWKLWSTGVGGTREVSALSAQFARNLKLLLQKKKTTKLFLKNPLSVPLLLCLMPAHVCIIWCQIFIQNLCMYSSSGETHSFIRLWPYMFHLALPVTRLQCKFVLPILCHWSSISLT